MAQCFLCVASPGEYGAASAATAFSYEVKLEPPQPATDAAYVSWLTSERGFLMLGDLLPLALSEKGAQASATVRFTLPANWSIASNEKKRAGGQFEITDAEQAVFFVGQDVRQKHERTGSIDFTFIKQRWAFKDEDVCEDGCHIIKTRGHYRLGGAHSAALVPLRITPMSAER